MALENAQLVALKAAILAETDPAFVAWRASGAEGAMADFLNSPASPAVLVWRNDVSALDLDEASNYAVFDAVVAGKRDAWALFLQYAPRDFTRNKVRKVVEDVWGNSNSASTTAFAIYTAATRAATRAEVILGGAATATEGTGAGAVTARRLSWTGRLSSQDVHDALMVA